MVAKAILDRAFIRLKKETATKGGILLPDSSVNEDNIGIVESIGPDVTSVKVGDKVLFHVFDDLPSHDKDVVVVRESSLLGVFDDE